MSTPSFGSLPALLDRFPALSRLGLGRRRSIPVIRQFSATECGTTCLMMVLAYFGRDVAREELRLLTAADRDGASALAVLDAARRCGLRGRGARLELADLGYLAPGAILHWDFNHFVVFERYLARQGMVDLIDPAFGRRRVPLRLLDKHFTGVALLLEPDETFQPSRHREPLLRRAFGYVLTHAGSWALTAALSLLLQLLALGLPVLTGAVIDRVVPRADVHLLHLLCGGLVFLAAFQAVATLVRGYLLLNIRTLLDARLTLGFIDHLVSLPYSFFQRRTAGDLMMRLNSNATVRELLTAGTLSSLLDGVLVSLYLIFLFLLDIWMGLCALGIGLLQGLVFLLLRQRQRELLSQDLETQAQAQSYEVELFTGIETLKALGSEQRAVEHWSSLFVRGLNVSLERGALAALADSVTGTLRTIAPLLLLVLGAQRVLSGQLPLGSMLAASALAGGFLGPFASLISAASQLQLVQGYQERIDDVLRAAPEQNPGQARIVPVLRGEIRLDCVGLRYGPHSMPAVRDVSVHIQPGQFVAIVGRSGAGKSSLASLLLGLHQPTSGRVLFDGMDLRELDLPSIRRQLGIVTQQPALFGTTIRQNITLAAPQAELGAIQQAAQRACIHDEIAALPMQYETPLVDRGASLSGGQRQRIALARALLREPAILLLDEATSALDSVTERAVQTELSRLRCTRIVIAHRLSTIAAADLILVMQDGQLVEQGRHDELLARGGAYACLIAAQLHPDADAESVNQ